MSGLVPSTPFTASLFEDDRLAGVGEQLFGRLICANPLLHHYAGYTVWHYDAGGYEAYGIKFAIYLDPVRADTGALRLIPGSHLRPFHDRVAAVDPIGPRFSRAAATPQERQAALAGIGAVPCVVCDSDPGDPSTCVPTTPARGAPGAGACALSPTTTIPASPPRSS